VHKVHVKFIADELAPGLTNGDYAVTDGATVRDVITLCEQQCGATIPQNNFGFMYPLFNGKPIALDGMITKDGTLHICRVVLGG